MSLQVRAVTIAGALVKQILSLRPDTGLLVAMHGRLGVDLARQHRPDLILLNLNLPGLTGDEAFRELLVDPRTAHIPVFVCSPAPSC